LMGPTGLMLVSEREVCDGVKIVTGLESMYAMKVGMHGCVEGIYPGP
jgi:hypothetical protein